MGQYRHHVFVCTSGKECPKQGAEAVVCDAFDADGVQRAVVEALEDMADPDAVLALGDLQYECGELSHFQSHYHPTWGRVKSKTFPTRPIRKIF